MDVLHECCRSPKDGARMACFQRTKSDTCANLSGRQISDGCVCHFVKVILLPPRACRKPTLLERFVEKKVERSGQGYSRQRIL